MRNIRFRMYSISVNKCLTFGEISPNWARFQAFFKLSMSEASVVH